MKYDLVGVDSNAFSVLGYVGRAMRECGKSEAERNDYLNDAKSSDYNHLLAVSLAMVDRLNDELGGAA